MGAVAGGDTQATPPDRRRVTRDLLVLVLTCPPCPTVRHLPARDRQCSPLPLPHARPLVAAQGARSLKS